MEMADYTPNDFASESTLLLVASTYGDGEPPDNGAGFWRGLNQPDAPDLSHLRYGVLALGDSSYGRFCGYGRMLDARLAALGATALVRRGECDGDGREAAQAWLSQLFGTLGADHAAPSLGDGAGHIRAAY
jgi:sulfite reductase (NADPH) flavoprotein alpha-component